MILTEQAQKILKWYQEYPFRIEKGTDISFVKTGPNPKSKLSPLTDIMLNVLTSDKSFSNFIICYPSNTLKTIPLISYILADQNKRSVLVFSKNNEHYKNYYLLKMEYARNWAYTNYPAGKIFKGTINIELHAPRAKTSYKNYFKSRIPKFKEQFFDENYPKILFNQSKNIRFSDSITNLNLENEKIHTAKTQKLGIGNIIFENLDYFVYSSYKFESFANWIREFRDDNHRFVFHISNPNYKLLVQLKELFNAYVLYFPFSFIKANQDLKKRNKEYFKNLSASPEKDVLNFVNLDSSDVYSRNKAETILIINPLKRGNIDRYFQRAIKLFEKINWKDVQPNIAPIIYKLKYLCFSVYKMFCIPREFGVKYYNSELGWRYPPLEYYLETAYDLFKRYSNAPTFDYLVSIHMYLSKMVFELSECKRYAEPKSYTRKAKNCALCEYLENNSNGSIIIGVQSGEKRFVYEKVEQIANNGHVQVATLRQIARSVKDFSDYTLLLAGFLLPNQFQILFKPWKEIRFFVYKGKDYRWVKKQIKLIDRIDIEKEEQTFKFLAEIYRDMLEVPETTISKIGLFKNFVEKKKRFLKAQEVQEDSSEPKDLSLTILDTEVSLSSVTDIVRQIMKSDKILKDIITAEKTKSVVKRYHKKDDQKLLETTESFKCIAGLKNEITGETQTVRLDVKKKYLYFNNPKNIKIESHFPHSLREGQYIILFGERKESISDFVKNAFGLEEDIDHDLIEEWQGRLAEYYIKNRDRYTSYKKFHTQFVETTPSEISSVQFNNWVKGNTNYTLDPLNFYYLGEFMQDEFFIDNYKIICEEGKKIQRFNQKLSRTLKKLVVKVLNNTISRGECSPDELLLLENIENCIFKIVNIQINK